MTEVRSPQRKLEPDNAGSEELKQTSLRGMANKAKANKQHRFQKVVKTHCRGKAELFRYADDFVCVFHVKRDAERFYRVLPKRLGKFGLLLGHDR